MGRPAAGWRAVVTTLVAAAALGACTSTDGSGSATSTAGSGPRLSWATVTLPAGVEPKTLTTMGDRVLVGGLKAGDTPDTPSPTMLTIDAAGSQTPVPLNPQSPYAPLARWYSVATDGTRIVAIGGANGGAHANVRWTTWAGTAAGVDELPQSFYAFGGWGAGDLVDAVITPGGDALVGSWGGAKAGLDAAVWTFADRVWTRQESAGTALESTATLLVGPRGATGDGDGDPRHRLRPAPGPGRRPDRRGVAVLRSQHRLAPHRPAGRRHPQRGGLGAVLARRRVLPGHRTGGRPAGAVGPARGHRDRTGRTARPSASGTRTSCPRPMSAGPHSLVVSPSAGQSVVLSSAAEGWATSAGPTGLPVAAALVGDRLYVATRPTAGAAANLFVARWPG